MAVKIRLKRMGSKRSPFYRLVVADSRSPRDGRFIEEIGYYNPVTEPVDVKIDEEKALDWMMKGAKPSDTVRNLFSTAGLMEKLHNAKNQK
ncbi:30S ribosomal protein S16 [Pseudalkalibacillus decolorationis]|uniref:30S ribosomal protein S16 n=1 Tax=Pseudalkalibacillus decolorationis TaxID=163879 RepID=UPI0021478312|nr:30S ribosomal protein S16 [Pseudalkalibacillus decolorationis]